MEKSKAVLKHTVLEKRNKAAYKIKQIVYLSLIIKTVNRYHVSICFAAFVCKYVYIGGRG
jgi:hypothetical protein